MLKGLSLVVVLVENITSTHFVSKNNANTRFVGASVTVRVIKI